MSTKKNIGMISVTIVGCAAVFISLFLPNSTILKKEAAVERGKEITVGWKEGFVPVGGAEKTALPNGWILETKPGTRAAIFSVEVDEKKRDSFLHMESDKASATLITRLDGLDLKKTPFLRWRWRAKTLPKGADGRVKAKDDQAIGIYVGTGSILNNKSISYRWDTETPKGAEGNCAYGLGSIRIKWYTLRNKEDAIDGRWLIEERNVVEDFKEAWGFYPDEIYLSVSCNSQYTNSQSAADLGWIEFVSPSAG